MRCQVDVLNRGMAFPIDLSQRMYSKRPKRLALRFNADDLADCKGSYVPEDHPLVPLPYFGRSMPLEPLPRLHSLLVRVIEDEDDFYRWRSLFERWMNDSHLGVSRSITFDLLGEGGEVVETTGEYRLAWLQPLDMCWSCSGIGCSCGAYQFDVEFTLVD